MYHTYKVLAVSFAILFSAGAGSGRAWAEPTNPKEAKTSRGTVPVSPLELLGCPAGRADIPRHEPR